MQLQIALRIGISDFYRIKKLDVSASYPHGELVYNISKETTSKELVRIEGIPEDISKTQNMLLSSGHVDAVEYCTNMLGFPKLTNILEHYNRSKQ